MSPALRRGTCPTLAAPMETGDGLLARLYPVSGGIAPALLASIAEAAARSGNGLLEVTMRGSLQIRGLTPRSAPDLADAIGRLDIRVRTGVPVETGPLAGLDPEETADPLPLAERIREAIATAGLSARLGPKVSVVVDGGGRLSLDEVLADVRLEATRRDDVIAWRVAIGGTHETARVLGFIETETACAAVLALLESIAAKGRTSRAKELTDDVLEDVLSRSPCTDRASRSNDRSSTAVPLPLSVLPDISATRGEIGLRGRPLQSSPSQDGMRGCDYRSSPRPSRGEDAGRQMRGGAKAAASASHPYPLRVKNGERETSASCLSSGAAPKAMSPVATLALSDGRTALGIALPFGQATARQIVALAESASRAGADEIRFAPGRALLVLCPTTAAADALRAALSKLGFVTDPADPRLAIVACAGAPACASGHLPARAIAADIATLLPSGLDGAIHVSGCVKQCARPAHAAFTLIGTVEGCEIHRGDGLRGRPVTRVANDDAAAAFGRAAKLYPNDKKNGKEAAIGH